MTTTLQEIISGKWEYLLYLLGLWAFGHTKIHSGQPLFNQETHTVSGNAELVCMIYTYLLTSNGYSGLHIDEYKYCKTSIYRGYLILVILAVKKKSRKYESASIICRA